ncbi:MAG: hypothetical protein JWQ71_2757, partial [Pedosphaera sp.]|nr:hypothetical protein [Pedosphaera sp.]
MEQTKGDITMLHFWCSKNKIQCRQWSQWSIRGNRGRMLQRGIENTNVEFRMSNRNVRDWSSD